MSNELKVKKWGGENTAELTKSPQNIVDDHRNGIKQAVVVSAMRSDTFNTTDKLIELAILLAKKEISTELVKEKISEIKNFHLLLASEKLTFDDSKKIEDLINNEFDILLDSIISYIEETDKIKPTKKNDYLVNTCYGDMSLLRFGERISSIILSEVTNLLGIEGLKTRTVFLEVDEKGEYENFTEECIKYSEKVSDILEKGEVPIIEGYIDGYLKGIMSKFGKGYSDPNTAKVALGLSKLYEVTIEIQKKVAGILSTDPELVKGTNEEAVLIPEIDYLTTKEIIGVRAGQAKLLHHDFLIKEIQKAGIKIHLFNPFDNSKGTIISRNKNPNSSGIEFIGGRDNIIVITVSSGEMKPAGILATTFGIVKNYCPVGIVSASETEVSFTIDDTIDEKDLNEMLDKIKSELSIEDDGYENFVKYDNAHSLISCVGQNLSHKLATLGRIGEVLGKGGINIGLVSQGILERAISFTVNKYQKKDAVVRLHEEFIKE